MVTRTPIESAKRRSKGAAPCTWEMSTRCEIVVFEGMSRGWKRSHAPAPWTARGRLDGLGTFGHTQVIRPIEGVGRMQTQATCPNRSIPHSLPPCPGCRSSLRHRQGAPSLVRTSLPSSVHSDTSVPRQPSPATLGRVIEAEKGSMGPIPVRCVLLVRCTWVDR